MMTSNEIRDTFLKFFQEKQHQIVPSAPMVIKGDPTLMFTNAGMNQFKDIILGYRTAEYKRVADAQKCLRVSGKHNDLEEVGHDTYHHTMFEMLGNWSFGDYFKKEAISWAWELLTKVYKIDPARLYITYFEGAEDEGLAPDDEAKELWLEHVSEDHILKGNRKDNFWEMGDQGPCGPCSEIHLDLRSEEERQRVSGRELVNKSHPEVIEIWNLVFMQYNRKADGSLDTLPFKVIDTGMGFERLTMALQGKRSSYDTDIFTPLLQALTSLTGVVYGDKVETDIAMRVIADHVRTIAFAIADGQLPSNAKAGYVIRRILRRAVRYGYTYLGRKQAFMYTLIPTLQEIMGGAYPELIQQGELITKVIKEEEESFLRTLETGIRLLDKYIEELVAQKSLLLDGARAFELYDTYGFPLDLTALILSERGMRVDEEGFAQAMQAQKDRARNAQQKDTGDWIELASGDSTFVGYDSLEVKTRILKYRQIKQQKKTFYQVVFAETPFYAEMGGQVGDQGFFIDQQGKRWAIVDTIKENNLPVHIMPELPEEELLALEGLAVVNAEKRRETEANHTATHLLHEALREVLGEHVEQKGSFVSSDLLRFDFSHYSKVEPEQLRMVEQLVNSRIRADYPRQEYRDLPIAQAQEMGAMALFGEKYGDVVRVLKYGSSIELCGGTHVSSTGVIGLFRIVSESSVAAGIRRIEAYTGAKAENYQYAQEDLLRSLKEALGNSPQPLVAINKLLEDRDNMKLELEAYARIFLQQKKEALLAEDKRTAKGFRLFLLEQETNADLIKDLAFQIAGQLHEPFVLIAGIEEANSPKCQLMLMLSKSLTEAPESYNAAALLKEAAKNIKGGGGGQPHFATAGGKDKAGMPAAIEQLVRAF